jgi:signal transduction histidine kinase
MRGRLTDVFLRYGDAALGGGIALLALLQIVGADVQLWSRLAAAVVAVLLGVAAALRVRYPLALLALLVVTMPLGALLPKRLGDVEAIGLFVVLAIYTAAAHTSGREMTIGALLTVALWVAGIAGDPEEANLAAVVFFGVLFGAPWAAGRVVRRRRLNEERLEREKEEAETAIAEERARIARELHDVVAHAISVMVVQARAGRKVFASKPDDAREAFDTIEHTGSQALDEMRRLLGMLRTTDDELALAPQPSLSQVDALVERVRSSGLPVEVAVEGQPVELPPGVDLSAYRIVQEALTNALKHAGPARARVLIRYAVDELAIEISDTGSGSGNGGGSGQGIAGMRERVAVFGGELEAGQRDEGGYTLRARLPYASARP